MTYLRFSFPFFNRILAHENGNPFPCDKNIVVFVVLQLDSSRNNFFVFTTNYGVLKIK